MGSHVQKVVTLANSLDQSKKGRYWVGQTPQLHVGQAGVYVALSNPVHSKCNLFVNVFTVTAFTNTSLIAKVWLNAKAPKSGTRSRLLANTNTTICPMPSSPIQMVYAANKKRTPSGVNVFDRVVSGQSTVVAEEDGKYIIPPGKSFLITLQPLGAKAGRAALAFGWWTERLDESR